MLGHIDPTDPKAPPIRFQVNLPLQWNGRTVQYGGGGFNGIVITGLGLPPAAPFDSASPLARGFATYGTDSGHETKPGEPPQLFAANDEAFVNFAHASYKKVRDVAVMLTERAYGAKPERMYYVGSSEGGREGLTMAQRYPDDFDGIFARVPVINWVGLQHAGTRAGLATMGDGWIRPAQVKLVHDAVLAACDAQDGIADALVQDAVGCKARFDPAKLLCGSSTSGDQCLSEPQIAAIRTLLSPYKFSFALANGVSEYPGWGVSGEATKSYGPTGGWSAWWLGAAPPALPPQPNNGIAWIYGAGGIAHIFARNPGFDISKYRPEDFAERVREVSALMDFDQSRPRRVQGPRRQARHARTHGRLRAEPLRRDRLFSGSAEAHGRGRGRRVCPPLCRAGRRSCRQRRAIPGRHAPGPGRLGGKWPRPRRSRRRRTATGIAGHDRPLAAAVPVAGLAALQGRRSEERGEFCVCAVM